MLHSIPKKIFTFLGLVLLLSASTSAQIATEKQKKEWQKLYPKLNSKMARMEEILNHIERFLGENEFKDATVEGALEFSFLAKKSSENIPQSLNEKQRKPYLKALKATHELGIKLHNSLKKDDYKKAKEILLQLEKIRRNSHTKWA